MARQGTLQSAVITASMILVCGPAEAVHFSETGTAHLAASNTLTLTLVGTCNFDWDSGDETLTIAPDPGESPGDPVMLDYCYSAVASASIADQSYRAVGGVGGLSFGVGCPYSYSNPDPATIVLNPGPGQQTLLSLGPDTVNPGDPPYSLNDCDSVVAHIGDVIRARGAVFAVVDGPQSSAETLVTLTYSFDVDVQAAAIPTTGGAGLLALSLLLVAAGLTAVRRPRQPR